ncbi:MAG: exodeoxyribonuclease VII large subunit [Candidatus Omnitrophota bacterium]|jgi:exodeoxyribonuclease VII large subunit
MSDKIYTVLELNTEVRELIREKFSGYIWVCGEIQSLRPERSKKHTYFELVQKHSIQDEIVAKVKVALFAGRKIFIEKRLREAAGGFELKNDIEVKFLCEVSLHPPTGQYSLIVVDIDTVYTLGKIAQNRLKIIEDLRTRGLLERNKLQTISDAALKVGLITAYDSAAYHDFTHELKISGCGFMVLACNCHMQGKAVEGDVSKAIDVLNSLGDNELDVIVITRGGGSTADLSYFDSKAIAEKIAGSKFPVVSALGHHIDTTITDMVSHTSCKTPTKAAQFLVEKVKKFLDVLYELQQNILSRSQELLKQECQEVEGIAVRIDALTARYFRAHREELLKARHELSGVTGVIFAKENQQVAAKWMELRNISGIIFRNGRDNLSHLESKVSLLDPRNILKRGYSMTLKGKKAIKSVKDVIQEQTVKTVLYDGNFISRVESITKN